MGEEAWGPGLSGDWILADLSCAQGITAQLLAAAWVVKHLMAASLWHRFPVSGLGGSWGIYFLHQLLLVWFFPPFLFFFSLNQQYYQGIIYIP